MLGCTIVRERCYRTDETQEDSEGIHHVFKILLLELDKYFGSE